MNYEQQEFYNKRLDFTYQGQDYIWFGDYKVSNASLRVENDVRSNYEVQIEVLDTDFCAYYREYSDVLIPITPTNDLICQIKIEIKGIL